MACDRRQSLELENDDDLLAAALSFVDEALLQPLTCESEGTTDVLDVQNAIVLSTATASCDASAEDAGSSANDSNSKTTRRKRPSGFDPNRARAERKVELVHLRQQVQEMEAKLAELNGATSDGAHAVTLRAVSASRVSDSAPAVWEAIAFRQRTQRQESEKENIRLRFVLEEQLKVARGLEKLLKKRMSSEILRSPVDTLRLKRFKYTSSDYDEANIFESLHKWAGRAYRTNLDAIFDANGLSRSEHAFHNVRLCPGSSDGDSLHLELCANKIMPFDLRASSNAVWHHFTRSIKQMPRRAYVPLRRDITDDTVVESFMISLDAKQTSANFRVHQVLRRFVEEDRAVIVWRAVIDPMEMGSEQTRGVRFFEDAYIVTKRPKILGSGFSLVQSCFIVTPEAATEGHGSVISELSKFFVDTVGRRIELSHQMIENGLLEGTVSRLTH